MKNANIFSQHPTDIVSMDFHPGSGPDNISIGAPAPRALYYSLNSGLSLQFSLQTPQLLVLRATATWKLWFPYSSEILHLNFCPEVVALGWCGWKLPRGRQSFTLVHFGHIFIHKSLNQRIIKSHQLQGSQMTYSC